MTRLIQERGNPMRNTSILPADVVRAIAAEMMIPAADLIGHLPQSDSLADVVADCAAFFDTDYFDNRGHVVASFQTELDNL